MQINGLYRHGFMIAPAMLDVAMELLAHRPLRAREPLRPGAPAWNPTIAMNILINDTPHDAAAATRRWPTRCALIQATPPFAAAVNRQFVPRSQLRRRTRCNPTTASK